MYEITMTIYCHLVLQKLELEEQRFLHCFLYFLQVVEMLADTHMFRELLWPRFMPMVRI